MISETSPEPASPAPVGGMPSGDSTGALLGWGVARFLIVFVVLFAVGVGVISIFGTQGWLAYRKLENEAVQLRSEVEQLEAHRQSLVRELDALRNDPAYIELLARQRLGLVRPGERVVQLPQEPQAGKKQGQKK